MEYSDFERLRFLLRRRQTAKKLRDAARDAATRISPSLSGMPGGSGGNGSEQKMMAVIEAERELRRVTDEIRRLKGQIGEAVQRMPDGLEREALVMRYLEERKIEALCVRLHYSRSSVFRILESAERNAAELGTHGTRQG